MNHEYVMVLTTLPVDADGPGFARRIIDERLAACVNLLAPMESIYRWEGAIEQDTGALGSHPRDAPVRRAGIPRAAHCGWQ
jgi:hypothetical protein